MQTLYWFIPLISAGIGWFTNYLAIRMIFYPRQPIRWRGLSFQGLIPKRQRELAESIGNIVQRELVFPQDIANSMRTPESQQQLRQNLEKKIDHFLQTKVLRIAALYSTLNGLEILQKMKRAIITEVVAMLPDVTERVIAQIEESIDFKQIVVDRIEQFDMEKLETLILQIARRELQAIELLGGVLGFLIGVVQVVLLVFL
ncbi:MAG: DUF445 family protein [Nitrospinota bacterium]|nr:MAG: DUF445 family protein [Nitrospinota bacterium]